MREKVVSPSYSSAIFPSPSAVIFKSFQNGEGNMNKHLLLTKIEIAGLNRILIV